MNTHKPFDRIKEGFPYVLVDWQANPEKDVVGYFVYVVDEEGSCKLSFLPGRSQSHFLLKAKGKVAFIITAVNDQYTASDPSGPFFINVPAGLKFDPHKEHGWKELNWPTWDNVSVFLNKITLL